MSFIKIELFPITIIGLLIFILFPVLLRWLWNRTMPEIFNLTKITYYQALRLFIISFMLFGIWMIG